MEIVLLGLPSFINTQLANKASWKMELSRQGNGWIHDQGRVCSFVRRICRFFEAPIQTNTNAIEVAEFITNGGEQAGSSALRFKVTAVTNTDSRANPSSSTRVWLARNVVLATGYCDLPNIPNFARNLPVSSWVRQIAATDYKNPSQVLSWFQQQPEMAGRSIDNVILVVGAGASGIQIAHELGKAVRQNRNGIQPRVMISVGRHCRWPRTYRGKDILWWMDQMGAFRSSAVQQDEASSPGPQLSGYPGHADASLYQLHNKLGVQVVGKTTIRKSSGSSTIQFDNAMLADCLKQADDGCIQVLKAIDQFIIQQRLDATNTTALTNSPFEGSCGDPCPRLESSTSSDTGFVLPDDGFPTQCEQATRMCIIWATGFTRQYPFLSESLHERLWDAERFILENHGGITTHPGLYVLGYRWLRRKHSNFVDGVGDDARELAQHIA
ncbi:FAD binding domain (Partial), partial [Seminavis robusta]|eukprot:Sro4241_g353490.1 FAD binding domain (439) ;mRNA; r:2-1319